MPSSEQAPASGTGSARAPGPRGSRRLRRLLLFLLVAGTAGTVSRAVSSHESSRTTPAGFGPGLLHGIIMPIALPALTAGADPIIYANLNTGRGYKLGYTLGVNGCGAVFFGTLYRRRRQYQNDRKTS